MDVDVSCNFERLLKGIMNNWKQLPSVSPIAKSPGKMQVPYMGSE